MNDSFTDSWSRAVRAGLAVLLMAATVAVYANAFGGIFIFDDFDAVLYNTHIRGLTPISRFLNAPPSSTASDRPLLSFTLALSYAWSGYETWGYHAFNVALHAASGLLLFGLLRRTFLRPLCREHFASNATPLAFAAALLWLVHPLQTTCVTYIVQRTEALGAFFILLTLYASVRRLEPSASRIWSVMAFVACCLGVLAKETVAVAPVLALLYHGLFSQAGFQGLRSQARYFVALFATWSLIGITVLTGERINMVSNHAEHNSPFAYLCTQAGVIVYYLKLAFWPDRLCFVYDWPYVRNVSSVVIPGLGVVALLAATVLGYLRRQAWSFLGVLFFLALAPSSSLVVLALRADEHRMYLALAAPVTLVVCGCYRLGVACFARGRWPATVTTVLAAVVLVASALALGRQTRQANELYRDERTLWLDVLDQEPHNGRAHLGLGMERLKNQKGIEALPLLLMAYARMPDAATVLNALGAALILRGQHEAARPLLQTATENNPRFVDAQNNLGMVLATLGDLNGAERHLLRAIELSPDLPEPYMYMGWVRIRQKRYAEALDFLEHALQLNPNLTDAKNYFDAAERALVQDAVARTSLQVKRAWERCQDGRWIEGLELLYRARRLLPQHPEAAHYLKVVTDKAESDIGASETPEPELLHVLATAYAVQGRFEEAVQVGELAWRAAEASDQAEMAAKLKWRAELFKQGKPFPDQPADR
ncbi:MAG: hypothetical protein AMXMBFR7_12240 [Planctomycetota bacterium]